MAQSHSITHMLGTWNPIVELCACLDEKLGCMKWEVPVNGSSLATQNVRCNAYMPHLRSIHTFMCVYIDIHVHKLFCARFVQGTHQEVDGKPMSTFKIPRNSAKLVQ